jgi:hypothetical protein
MDELFFIDESSYQLSPSAYIIDGRVYTIAQYILDIDTYSIINDVTQYGEHFSTSEELFGEYGVTVDAYVYEPPLPRYTSWTFGDAIWAVFKVAGVVVGCVTFVYSVLNGTLIALLKTIPYALLDLKDLVVGAVTKTTTLIFPRIQMLWPNFYNSIVSLATHGEKIGWMPYYDYIDGVKTVSWLELDTSISVGQSVTMSASSASSLGNSVLDWTEIEKHAEIGGYKPDMVWNY